MVATKKVSGVSSLIKIPFIVHGLEESYRNLFQSPERLNHIGNTHCWYVHGLEESYRILFQSPERLTILEALTVGMFRGQKARQQLLCILFCPMEELETCCLSGAAGVSSSFRSSVCLTTSVIVNSVEIRIIHFRYYKRHRLESEGEIVFSQRKKQAF